MRGSVCFLCAAISFGIASAFISLGNEPIDFGVPKRVNATHSGFCGTEAIYARKKMLLQQNKSAVATAVCGTEAQFEFAGKCDVPATRDATNTDDKVISIAVIVIGNEIITEKEIEQQLETLALDFSGYGIVYKRVHTAFYPGNCIPSFSGNEWYTVIQALKEKYAYNPKETLNIFVTCQDPSPFGTLLGFGTFPWDPEALSAAGGVWVNSDFFGLDQKTLDHEIGHNVGLWHTFHGVSETSGCSDPCYENYHPLLDPAADLVGDFCSDTPATPVNYNCAAPGGFDCNGRSWGQTDFSNLMAYADDSCIDHFNDQQVLRMHCWVCSNLTTYITSGSC